MRATLMYGAGDVRVENVADPRIEHPTDALVRITASCICGSDLHPYSSMGAGSGPARMGHEFIGVVEDVVHRRRVGVVTGHEADVLVGRRQVVDAQRDRAAGSPGGIFFPRIFPMSGCAARRSGKEGASAGWEGCFCGAGP